MFRGVDPVQTVDAQVCFVEMTFGAMIEDVSFLEISGKFLVSKWVLRNCEHVMS